MREAAQQRDSASRPSLDPLSLPSSEDGVDADAGEDEEDEEAEERVVGEAYEGEKDEAGRPHGAGCLTIAFLRGRHRGRNVFQGRFHHGLKSTPPPHTP